MTPTVRKFALTAHVTSSVGWLGSVAAFLAVALVALMNSDDLKARAASTTMELIGWYVIVPFSAASLLSGVNPVSRHNLGSVPSLLGCCEAADFRWRQCLADAAYASRQQRCLGQRSFY